MDEKPEDLEEIDERLGDLWSMSRKEQEDYSILGIAGTVAFAISAALMFWWMIYG